MTDPILPLPTGPQQARPRTGLLPHLVACAIGAGLDNLFRMVAIIALNLAAKNRFPGHPEQASELANTYASWALMLFSAPFVLLAPTAGSLGDRLPKQVIIRAARVADIFICGFGIWGFAISSPLIMLSALFLLGIASTFFAPVKLAVIPELVSDQHLARANAQLAAVTVLSILCGSCAVVCIDGNTVSTFLAYLGRIIALHPQPVTHATLVWSLAIICGVGCLIGVIAAFRVPGLQAQAPRTPVGMPWMVVSQVRALNGTPGLWAPALALAGFWALGGVAMIGLPALAQIYFPPSAQAADATSSAGTVGLFLALVVGICIGSALAPRYRARAFPAGLPVFSAALAGAAFVMVGLIATHDGSAAGLAQGQHHLGLVMAFLTLTGMGAGLWEVSLTVILQERSPAQRRNLIMSGVSVLGSVGAIVSAACVFALSHAHTVTFGHIANFSMAESFQVLGGVTLLGAVVCAVIYRRACAAWLITVTLKLAYRVRVHGAEHLPVQGGCLVVCNHQSYVDGLILGSNLPRSGRFLVYRQFVDMPVVGFFLRAAGVIPVAAEDRRKALLASIDAAVAAAKAGEVVVIFPEGKITRSGQIDAFRAGLERIATRAGVPIVPAYISGLWGTIASLAPRRSLPRPWRSVELRIGSPMSSGTSASQARDQVINLTYQSAQARAQRDSRTLAGAFISQARRHPGHIAIRDAGGAMSNATLLGISRALIPHLGPLEERVGVILPPGRAGTLVNLALALAGRTAINLNHTSGAAQLQRMCSLAGIRSVITASLYLRKINLVEVPGRPILIEQILPRLGKFEVLRHMLLGLLMPKRITLHSKPDDVAAIVFSSGSTGDPKGVELTHRQVLANCDCTEDGLDVHGGQDILLNPLPLFHSFGLVPGMWLGLTKGMTVVAHPDPSDGKALGELAMASSATFLISTPTFVRGYLRRTEPHHFASMRFVVVGAERCPPDLMDSFKQRFSCDLLEGYGCTELGPVVGVNLQDVHRAGVDEIRRKIGTIGRALPGLQVFAVDPDSLEMLEPGREGLLVVRSPSLMRGYLDRADLTTKACIHGGYNTGDIGKVDGDGFVSITGRLARFAKVGGEMVPLDNVESALQRLLCDQLGSEHPIEIAVAAQSDESRGERLIVLHTGYSGDWSALLDGLKELPALWRPKIKDVRQVASIPKLGTGKRDLSALKALAAG